MTVARIQDVTAGFQKVGEDVGGLTDRVEVAETETAKTSGKVSGYVTLEQFGGDATPGYDNAAALAWAKTDGRVIDLLGKSYDLQNWDTISANATGLRNGSLRRMSDGYALHFDADGNFWTLDGRNWQAGLTPYDVMTLGGAFPNSKGWHRGVFAAGAGALHNATTDVHSIVAIGPNTISQAEIVPRYNLAIGDSALTHLSASGGGHNGTRNIGLGSLAGHFITTGKMNTAIGRDSLHSVTTGGYNTGVGYQSLVAGVNPIGWTGGIELQWGGKTSDKSTAVGAYALQYAAGDWNTAIGSYAMPNIKSAANNVAAGVEAGLNADANINWTGKASVFDLSTGFTYTSNGTTVTLTLGSVPSIGLAVGYTIGIAVTTGPLTVEMGKVTLLSVAGSVVTFADPVGVSGSGAGTLWSVETLTTRSGNLSENNVLIGRLAGRSRLQVFENVMVGDAAGAGASDLLLASEGNTLIGVRAGRDHVQMTDCAFFGRNAGRWLIDGTTTATIANSAVFGANGRVSGNNQVQLGDSATTPYAYAALQTRSDERDKADVQPTTLGLDFIERIEPVQYRWDMRDDYIADIPAGKRAAWWANPVKDGSQKRTRLHQGVIAQQVRAVCDDLGVDFSGLQDHTVNGGNDVLTVAYEHFIPVLIRAVQELSTRVKELESHHA